LLVLLAKALGLLAGVLAGLEAALELLEGVPLPGDLRRRGAAVESGGLAAAAERARSDTRGAVVGRGLLDEMGGERAVRARDVGLVVVVRGLEDAEWRGAGEGGLAPLSTADRDFGVRKLDGEGTPRLAGVGSSSPPWSLPKKRIAHRCTLMHSKAQCGMGHG
jgi:hypothetical protein